MSNSVSDYFMVCGLFTSIFIYEIVGRVARSNVAIYGDDKSVFPLCCCRIGDAISPLLNRWSCWFIQWCYYCFEISVAIFVLVSWYFWYFFSLIFLLLGIFLLSSKMIIINIFTATCTIYGSLELALQVFEMSKIVQSKLQYLIK